MANSLIFTKNTLLFFFVIIPSFLIISQASDQNILTDFIVPPNTTIVDGSFFTFTKFRGILDAPTPPKTTVISASMAEFAALNGQSVSFSLLRVPPGGVSAPHTRPHATGLLFVIQGSLEVGFVDTSNKLYTQSLQLGDMFIFPKGLVHYQYNSDSDQTAIALATFGSASAGTVSMPATLFSSGIDEGILAKSCKTNVATIRKIKAGLAPKV